MITRSPSRPMLVKVLKSTKLRPKEPQQGMDLSCVDVLPALRPLKS